MPTFLPTAILAVCLGALACSATRNPERPAEPAPYSPPPRQATAPTGGSSGEASDARPADTEASTAKPQAATAPAPPAAADGAPTLEGDPIVATVAGRPIATSDLLAELWQTSKGEVFEALSALILERLVQLEAARIGIEVDIEVVDAAYRASVDAFEDLIQRSRPNVSLDTFVAEVLDLDPVVYRARLRRRALHEELALRVYRAYYLTNDHALARLIVVGSEEAAEDVSARLANGEDFVAVAREVSIEKDDVDERGVAVPFIRGETLMSRLVFQTPVGEVAGPTRELGGFVFVRVEERSPPLAGRWPDLAQAVEASLMQRPIDPVEALQWQGAMQRRYEVDITSLLRLAGQPVEGK